MALQGGRLLCRRPKSARLAFKSARRPAAGGCGVHHHASKARSMESRRTKTDDNHSSAIGISKAAQCHASATLVSAVVLPVGCRLEDLAYRKRAPGIRVSLKVSKWLVMSHGEALRLTSLAAFFHNPYWPPRYPMLLEWTRTNSQVPH